MTNKINWTDEMLSKLGTVPDSEIAKKYGISRRSVFNKRKELDILPADGVPNRGTPLVNWTPELDALLGTMPDVELAEQLGVNRHVVFKRRVKLGLPRYSVWTNTALSMLGTMTDKELAELLGVHETTVLYQRVQRGIGPYRSLFSV